MFHYELTIPNSGSVKSIEISVFSMPILDSRMYVFHLPGRPSSGLHDDGQKNSDPDERKAGAGELLIIDPNLWDEADEPELKRICSN